MLYRWEGLHCAPHLLHPCSNVSQHEEKSLWDEIFKTREEWNQFKAGIMPMWGFRRRREESREGLVGEAKSDNTWGGIGVDALSALYNSALSWETPPSSEVQVNFNKQESNRSLAGISIIQSITFHYKVDHLKGGRRKYIETSFTPNMDISTQAQNLGHFGWYVKRETTLSNCIHFLAILY